MKKVILQPLKSSQIFVLFCFAHWFEFTSGNNSIRIIYCISFVHDLGVTLVYSQPA